MQATLFCAQVHHGIQRAILNYGDYFFGVFFPGKEYDSITDATVYHRVLQYISTV